MLQSRRSLLAVPGALLLSLLLAGQALAANTWSAPIPLTSSGSGFPFGIARVDNDTAVAALVEWNGNGYDVLAEAIDHIWFIVGPADHAVHGRLLSGRRCARSIRRFRLGAERPRPVRAKR